MSYVAGSGGFPQGAVAPAVTAASPSWWSVVVLFVCLQLPRPDPVQAAVCPSQNSSQAGGCLCASDILSCTTAGLDQVPREMPVSVVTLDLSHNQIAQLEDGSFEGLNRLETLRIAHNRLTAIQPGAFRNASGTLLRHLDLSSNQLGGLKEHYFLDLPGLKELLLFNNHIVHVESGALAGLGSLHKVYLSHNRITDFPFFSIQEHSHPHLSMLDLSSNHLSKLPLEDITNLPISIQRGLYLHNNSLLCECSMYGLFRYWDQRRFASVTDFRQEYTCLVYGIQRGTVRFFQHGRYFEKCNLTSYGFKEQEGSVSVKVGKPLLLHCVTGLAGRHVTFLWVSPNQEYVAPPGNNGSLKMYANGSLEIVAARAEDSGIYWCMSQDRQRQRNETQEVNVTVVLHDDDPHEPFNTGFTTLLGCVVSLVLVLMYLYLTPCRCPPCCKAPTLIPATATPSQGNEAGAGSAQSSILSPTPPATTEGPGRKVSTNKHVVFLEPIREQQNGRLRAGNGRTFGSRFTTRGRAALKAPQPVAAEEGGDGLRHVLRHHSHAIAAGPTQKPHWPLSLTSPSASPTSSPPPTTPRTRPPPTTPRTRPPPTTPRTRPPPTAPRTRPPPTTPRTRPPPTTPRTRPPPTTPRTRPPPTAPRTRPPPITHRTRPERERERDRERETQRERSCGRPEGMFGRIHPTAPRTRSLPLAQEPDPFLLPPAPDQLPLLPGPDPPPTASSTGPSTRPPPTAPRTRPPLTPSSTGLPNTALSIRPCVAPP